MRRFCGAVLAACAISGGAGADEAHVWPLGPSPAFIDSNPWTDPNAPATGQDDAFVFADTPTGGALSQDAIAAAIRGDVERMSRPSGARVVLSRAAGSEARVSWAFGRFAAVSGDGRAYTALDAALDRGGPMSLADEQAAAEFAMASPIR